jgi:broad specificity phosphatase PhoE
VDDGLREIAYDEWEGTTEADLQEKHSTRFSARASDPALHSPPGGEPAFAVASRALAVFVRAQKEHATGVVAFVSHKATIRILASALVGVTIGRFRERFACPTACITAFEFGKRGITLVRLGDAHPLEAIATSVVSAACAICDARLRRSGSLEGLSEGSNARGVFPRRVERAGVVELGFARVHQAFGARSRGLRAKGCGSRMSGVGRPCHDVRMTGPQGNKSGRAHGDSDQAYRCRGECPCHPHAHVSTALRAFRTPSERLGALAHRPLERRLGARAYGVGILARSGEFAVHLRARQG